jgi:hypothetical protein
LWCCRTSSYRQHRRMPGSYRSRPCSHRCSGRSCCGG